MRRFWSRKTFLATIFSTAVGPFTISPSLARAAMRDPQSVAQSVKDEFVHAWSGYKRFAWGHDEVHPVSGKASEFFIKDHSFGLSMLEAVDTLYVMELDDEVDACLQWLRKNLTFDVDGEVEMFEAVIRMVAGLIVAHTISGDRFFVDCARDLADRLMVCFTKSPTGAPYRYANLRTGAVRGVRSNLAEVGSNILEFGDLSLLTGDQKYLDASLRAYKAVIDKRSELNLLGTYFDVEKGEYVGREDVAPDEPADSFYEYLYGGWHMLGNAQTRDWYRMLTDAILKYKVVHVNGNLWFQEVDYLTGKATGNTQVSELAAFYAELVAKGGDRSIGESYYDSWTAALQKFGLIPEEIDYATLTVVDPGHELRPEYPNSSFDLWFLTHDPKYRNTAYQYFEALKENCRCLNGYTVLTDVRTRPMTQGDHFPGYSFSENFKYLYLMFADSPRFDGTNYHLNTEGKIMRGLLTKPRV